MPMCVCVRACVRVCMCVLLTTAHHSHKHTQLDVILAYGSLDITVSDLKHTE